MDAYEDESMNRTLAAAAAGLSAVLLAAGCGNSATASTNPSYASLLASYGDTVGASAKATVSPTPAKLIANMERMDKVMGLDWLQQVCQTASDATVVGITGAKAAADFAAGYDVTAPAGAPSARIVYGRILGICASKGLR
jgi:hypothetical protein